MDAGADRYLHKKFKKQLSIEPRTNNTTNSSSNVSTDQTRFEESVPTTVTHHSTNRNETSVNLSVLNYVKSSISNSLVINEDDVVANRSSVELERKSFGEQSAIDISYVSSSSRLNNQTESTTVVTTSSILINSCSYKDTCTDEKQQEKGVPGGKYVCTYCNLACSKPSVLQKHIRAHTNERPYPCVSCGFSFKTRSNLYKHCRSRSHANRVMGNKAQEISSEAECGDSQGKVDLPEPPQTPEMMELLPQPHDFKSKPYKPRFHTAKTFYDENIDENQQNNELISIHINDLIDKNNTIVNTAPEAFVFKRHEVNSHEEIEKIDEPLNLTNKNRKRCMSEVSEPATQKSLIKELLLKNLYADTNMQCPHCKMIFQTVTELELHKMRNCRGITKSGPRYSRSSSVNVASILTQNKNAFDNIPQMQNAVFPLKSPGPFLGKTRLVESDKTKSFSFEDGIQGSYNGVELLRSNSQRYSLSPLSLSYDKSTKRTPVKLFGGEVKITQTSGETKSFKIDSKEDKYGTDPSYDYKMSENRVVKSTLQSGGTVMQNKPAYNKPEPLAGTPEVIRVYDTTPTYEDKNKLTPTNGHTEYKYTNIVDFSQNAAKLLAPNLKQLNLTIPGVPIPSKFIDTPLLTTASPTPEHFYTNNNTKKPAFPQQNGNINPLNLLINGKVVRYVPGMPGPVVAEPPPEQPPSVITTVQKQRALATQRPNILITPVEKHDEPQETVKSEQPSPTEQPPRRFVRPNSLSLKPSACSMKQHHGLTPTMFNQILISPDTPRGAKKYNEHFLHGNYFSYLDLKSSTKPVYCTLNKTQPFYVPHFKKLSMYSEWRQQDNKADKLYVSAYDSRQKTQRYSTAGSYAADYIVHSSYKFSACETSSSKDENQKNAAVLGGYESNEDYTYVRGRGRGRYVCDQCGIRCKKPSMLKKHIRTHSNDRPYTCKHCNFSFKTKGNLTKHMKSKAHTKNYVASGGSSSSSSAQQSGTQSEDSDTDDSGMDSSDESSTRQQEHEAAYGLLSLSQKPASTMHLNIDASSPSSVSLSPIPSITTTDLPNFMNAEQLVHVSKTNYVKNKILDQQQQQRPGMFKLDTSTVTTPSPHQESTNRLSQYLGISNMSRTLTYPYTSVHSTVELMDTDTISEPPEEPEQEKPNITNFNVIKRYNPQASRVASYVESCRNSLDIKTRCTESEEAGGGVLKKRRMMFGATEVAHNKHQKSEPEVIDLSMGQEKLMPTTPTVNGHAEHENVRLKYYENVEKTKNVYNHVASEEAYAPPTTMVYRGGNIMPTDAGMRMESDSRVNYIVQESPVIMGPVNNVAKKPVEYDNSAMETLADIATKQEKLEKNSVAKNVASEFLKLATKNEYPNGEDKTFVNNNKDVNDLVVKTEENKSCTICSKNFSKPSQLRLHMNIHYLERPFRCESCSVSFRTKGHLQKHERSASHHNKLSSSPALSSSEPRPFKCGDCNIAFRIHGHLAKHLRSKMHIMKLECSGKIPFGLYAELERSNSLLTEINTADGDQCLDSLKMLAKKVFINDPGKLTQLEERSSAAETDTDS